MTKRPNKDSFNQNSPQRGNNLEEFSKEQIPGDNSKGNKRNKDQRDKTNAHNRS